MRKEKGRDSTRPYIESVKMGGHGGPPLRRKKGVRLHREGSQTPQEPGPADCFSSNLILQRQAALHVSQLRSACDRRQPVRRVGRLAVQDGDTQPVGSHHSREGGDGAEGQWPKRRPRRSTRQDTATHSPCGAPSAPDPVPLKTALLRGTVVSGPTPLQSQRAGLRRQALPPGETEPACFRLPARSA